MYYVVDILKALACIFIFLYHCNTLLPGEWKFITIFGEDVGNCLFFMVSGFALFPSIKRTSWREFPLWYFGRLKRIVPLLAFAYFTAFLFGYYKFNDPNQLFVVFVYPTLYWFATAILWFYIFLFVLGKLIPARLMPVLCVLLFAVRQIRMGTVDSHYIMGFTAMLAGFIAREYVEGVKEKAAAVSSQAAAQNTLRPAASGISRPAAGDFLASSEAVTSSDQEITAQTLPGRESEVQRPSGSASMDVSKSSFAPAVYFVLALVSLVFYVVLKRRSESGEHQSFYYAAMGIATLFFSLSSLLSGAMADNALSKAAQSHGRLFAFIRTLGAMALPLYMVQCWCGGFIGFWILQHIVFPLSYLVNFVVVWTITYIVYRIFTDTKKT